MKNRIFISLFLITILTGCNTTLKTPDNFITTSITNIEEKIENQESFVFYFSTGTCSYCLKHKNNAITYLNTAPSNILYRVDVNTMVSDKRSEYALIVYNLLGETFYTVNGYLANQLYVPTTLKYENGIAIAAFIGVMEKSEFADWYTN